MGPGAAGRSIPSIDEIGCTSRTALPVFANVPIPGLPFPGFLYGGDVTVGTVEGVATTELSATSPVFAPPTCEPVIVTPTADLTLGS